MGLKQDYRLADEGISVCNAPQRDKEIENIKERARDMEERCGDLHYIKEMKILI